ncbi:MAG: hypothetical protein ABFD64_02690 [Armatimonadota bacterium]
MIGVCKRLALVLVLILGIMSPVYADMGTVTAGPTDPTVNSISNLRAVWTDSEQKLPDTEVWRTYETGRNRLNTPSPWQANPSYYSLQPDPDATVTETYNAVNVVESVYVELDGSGNINLPENAVGIKGVWLDRWQRKNVWPGGAFTGSQITSAQLTLPAGTQHVFVSYYKAGTKLIKVNSVPLPSEYTVYRYPVSTGTSKIVINPEILRLDPDTAGLRNGGGDEWSNLIGIYDNPSLKGINYAAGRNIDTATSTVTLARAVSGNIRNLYVKVSTYAVDYVSINGTQVLPTSYDPDTGEIVLPEEVATGQAVEVAYRPLGKSKVTVAQVPVTAVSGVWTDDSKSTAETVSGFDETTGKISFDPALADGTRSVYCEYTGADMQGVTGEDSWQWREGGKPFPLVRESDDRDQRYASLQLDPVEGGVRKDGGVEKEGDEQVDEWVFRGVDRIDNENAPAVKILADDDTVKTTKGIVTDKATGKRGIFLDPATDPVLVKSVLVTRLVDNVYKTDNLAKYARVIGITNADGNTVRAIFLDAELAELPDDATASRVSYYISGKNMVVVPGPLPMPATVREIDLTNLNQPISDTLRINPDLIAFDPDLENWRANALSSNPLDGYNILGVFDNVNLTGWNYWTPGSGKITLDATGAAVLKLNCVPSNSVTKMFIKISSYAVDGVFTQETGGQNYYPGRLAGAVAGDPATDPKNAGHEYAWYDANVMSETIDSENGETRVGEIHLARSLPTSGQQVYVTWRKLSKNRVSPARPRIMAVPVFQYLDYPDLPMDEISNPPVDGQSMLTQVPPVSSIAATKAFPEGTISIYYMEYYAGMCVGGTATSAIYANGLGRFTYQPMYIVPDETVPPEYVYRSAVSAGLNMSKSLQQPSYDINDQTNNLLLRDPRRHPVDYAPNFTTQPYSIDPANVEFKFYAGRHPERLGSEPRISEKGPISTTVHASTVSRAEDGTVDYGGTYYDYRYGLDWLTNYNTNMDFPVVFTGGDPLTPVMPSPIVSDSIISDDGASSTTYKFRVRYWNKDNIAPRPWLKPWADEIGATESTGVVLYLDLENVLDLPAAGQHASYRPHFMTKENPADRDYTDGCDYIYTIEPTSSNEYLAFLTGTYHYFFGCADDSLTFDDSDYTVLPDTDKLLFEYQLNAGSWANYGKNDRNTTRSSTGIDPLEPRNLTDTEGRPWMARAIGRRYSAFGDDGPGRPAKEDRGPQDWQIYVDRQDRAPGQFEFQYPQQYEWACTKHPDVSIMLSGYTDKASDGYARFFGTIKPFYRAVNPSKDTVWTSGGFGYMASRMETCGARTSTMLTFKVKCYQRDNTPPLWVKVYVNNDSLKILDYKTGQSMKPENGGYTGYTMMPAEVQSSKGQSQTPPYDYTLGVDYEYKTQLSAGPHTYFFLANDGIATALYPARPEGDKWIAGVQQNDDPGFDNNYCPGPYVNNACQLLTPSVTPATGIQGQQYVYRVLYKDADGQRPYQTKLYIDTGTTAGTISVDMLKEDPTASDYKGEGVWYVFNTATMEDFALAKGVRRYRFEFIDDWGRPADPNDVVKGETTYYPASGAWVDGPTIGENVPPTLRYGEVVSPDGTANGATLWQFQVEYKDINNDSPKYVTLYIGKLQADGTTIKWDNGSQMTQADPGDNIYSDGCKFVFQKRLEETVDPITGTPDPTYDKPLYYYAFEASDGVNLATWVDVDDPTPDRISESAGCILKETLTTTDNLTYSSSKKPLVGTLQNQPTNAGILIDPIVWRYPGGDTSSPEILSREDEYVCKGVNQNLADAKIVSRYYPPDPPGSPKVVVDPVDPAYKPNITEVLGVYDNPDLTGTNYFLADDDTPGTYSSATDMITLQKSLPYGQNWVWIKYSHSGNNTYTLNRWTGEFTFGNAMDPNDVLAVDYFFATKHNIPIGTNILPTLSNPKLTPMVGGSGTDFIYSVEYKETEGTNGQAPAFVRVVIDGVEHTMSTTVSNTPSYRSGVIYKYSAKLDSGAHTYYFTTSDGAGLVTLPETNQTTGKIEPYLGPWVNNTPALSDGTATPNPTSGSITTTQSVEYVVTYSDRDGDLPITLVPFTNDLGSADAVKLMQFPMPLLYVDNTSETWNVGIVDDILEDPAQPGKYRCIRVLGSDGQTANYKADQFAGKLLQFIGGDLDGRVYLIANNTSSVLKLMTDDIIVDGLAKGTTFSIGTLKMYKDPQEQNNYPAGVIYKIIIPQLLDGSHVFHYKAASIMTPPSWVGAPWDTTTVSSMVRYPASGELTGPSVAAQAPSGNHIPVLSLSSGDVAVSPASGKASDTYDFVISYRDGDGDPPRYHDKVMGSMRVVFSDGSYAADLVPVVAENQSDTSFYITDRRFTVKANGLPEGNHKFHFEASDGWNKVRWPVASQGDDESENDPVVVVNAKAKLTDTAVNPPNGDTNTTFTLSVKYSDVNGERPYVDSGTGKEQVWVEFGGDSSNKLYLTRIAADTDFASGVTYKGTKSGLPAGAIQTVFKTKDSLGELTTVSGPTIAVSTNLNVPVLASAKVFNTAKPADINELASGGTANTFRYEVKYSDPDGDMPVVVQNGTVVEGIKLYIDGVLEGVMTQRAADVYLQNGKPDYTKSVTYWYTKLGENYSSAINTHSFYFLAKDGSSADAHEVKSATITGPVILSGSIVMARQTYSTVSGTWVDKDPQLAERVKITGVLNESAAKPIPGSQTIKITITRPDGTVSTITRIGAAETTSTVKKNQFTFEMETPMMNKNWVVTAKWDGNSDYTTPVTAELKVNVRGPSRVVATQDMSSPATSTPVVDMVCMPLTAINGDPGSLFGYDRARLMQIVRWDPEQRTYMSYGDTYFPQLTTGNAVWILPKSQYPAETIAESDLVSPVDSSLSIVIGNQYRLLRPFGRLYDQQQDCEIVLKQGWNQIGSPYMVPTLLKDATVIYQGNVASIDQAAANGWIRNYAWMWDPATQQADKLIHPTRSDAYKRTIDPWRGYWIRALVNCTLVLKAPSTTATATSLEVQEYGVTARNSNAQSLDMPPAAPGNGK